MCKICKYVKIFEKFYLIIRDRAISSELCMEFGKKSFYFVSKFIYHDTFFEKNKILLCVTKKAFFLFKNLFFLCDEHHHP